METTATVQVCGMHEVLELARKLSAAVEEARTLAGELASKLDDLKLNVKF